MCGIVGIISFNEKGKQNLPKISAAVQTLNQRGPDFQADISFENSALGHARLSVIDTAQAAAQPFVSADKRYYLVYNGEIYNYKSLRTILQQKSYEFKTQSDTEVLLYWLIENGAEGIKDLNGFFAFCLYDKLQDSYLLGRDRFGIKPLLVYQDDDQVVFASEMKAILCFPIDKTIDSASLQAYFKFNYIPGPYSIFNKVKKIKPGHYWTLSSGGKIQEVKYYEIPYTPGKYLNISYLDAQQMLRKLLNESVEKRMVADVPLGAFLSGGIDSSIITALASQHTKQLHTFSVGYQDEPLFDETHYAQLVAKKYQTDHTVFKLKNQDLLDELIPFLDYTCEPFADSSALAVNILCKQTRQNLTVALSGDGADELFSGYHKHAAEFLARSGGLKNKLIKSALPLWEVLPTSRNSKIGNVNRQILKFSKGLNLNIEERYWDWAGYLSDEQAGKLVLKTSSEFGARKHTSIEPIKNSTDFNDFLYMDMIGVLPNDMLTKVDLYSMANSLEVRVPFLDHELVNFVFQLPTEFKIHKGMKKKVLQDAFRNELPLELYRRPKHGFEVPLLKWFKGELWDLIDKNYLNLEFINEQSLFNVDEVAKLKKQLWSKNPGDSTATIWAMLVFQHWWKKYMS